MHGQPGVVIGGRGDMGRLGERGEPDARGPGSQAEIIQPEDAQADRLDLLDQRVDRIMPGASFRLRKTRRMSITIRMTPSQKRTARAILQMRTAAVFGAPLQD